MFYVYDNSGLKFSGLLEKLVTKRRVPASQATKKSVFEDHIQQSFKESPNEVGVIAYQRMLKQQNMIEPLVHIYQIMSAPPVTISPTDSIQEAWFKLRRENLRQLIVTNEKMQTMGMLSDRDLLKHMNILGDEIKIEVNHQIADVISEEVITTDSISDIRRVARAMAIYHLDAIPVQKGQRLIGIVTRGDILRGFAENPRLNLWG